MSNPTRIGQEAPDLKTPSSPSRITPTRAADDARGELQVASRRQNTSPSTAWRRARRPMWPSTRRSTEGATMAQIRDRCRNAEDWLRLGALPLRGDGEKAARSVARAPWW